MSLRKKLYPYTTDYGNMKQSFRPYVILKKKLIDVNYPKDLNLLKKIIKKIKTN